MQRLGCTDGIVVRRDLISLVVEQLQHRVERRAELLRRGLDDDSLTLLGREEDVVRIAGLFDAAVERDRQRDALSLFACVVRFGFERLGAVAERQRDGVRQQPLERNSQSLVAARRTEQ